MASKKYKRNPRCVAAHVLVQLMQERGSLDTLLAPQLSDLSAQDVSFAKQLLFGATRYFVQLNSIANSLLSKALKAKDADILALILLGIYQLKYLRVPAYAAIGETSQGARIFNKPWAVGVVNGVLRRYQRESDALEAELESSDAFRYAIPEWILEKYQTDWPDDWQQLAEASNEPPPMVLRVNERKQSRDVYGEKLTKAEIGFTPGKLASTALTLDVATNVENLPAFFDGVISVQDEAAQLSAGLLAIKPGMRVLDACSAPGGKACHIMESQPDCELLAIEFEPRRAERIHENISRLGLSFAVAVADAGEVDNWWDNKLFDRILLDAPCSASGVLRRHPDIKMLRKHDDIVALSQQQLRLLINLWQTLQQDGLLLYVTCSVFKDENDQVVETFLKQTADAKCIKIDLPAGRSTSRGWQLLPGDANTDGFYYALLKKQ